MKLDKMLTPPIKASVISFLFAFALIAANTARATEYFVDCNRPDDSGDGLSESTAKRTIQAAIEAAEADADTPRIVTVLPGTYAEGGKVTSYECDQDAYKGTTLAATNRVHITKGLTLRAKDPTQLTEIVGAWDTSEGAADASIGIGPKAVRCVLIETFGRVVISGFTLRDGAAQDDNRRTKGGYWPTFAGGVAYRVSSYNDFILADCTIRHCSGRRGGSCAGAKLIRCRVLETYGPTLMDVRALSSVIFNQCHSAWSQYVLDNCRLCNCTVFGNEGSSTVYFSSGATICNSLVFGCGTFTGSTGSVNVTNSVTGSSWVGVGKKDEASVFEAPTDAYYMFESPLDGDWRVRGDSEYLTLGDAKYIADLDWAADFEPYKDLYGNAIPTSGAIAPGCSQTTFTPACGPIRLNSKRIIVDGTRRAYSGSYFYPDDKFAQYRLTLTLEPGEYLHSWNALYENWLRFPAVDDSLMVMPPPDVNVRCGNTPTVTTQALWVSPTGNDDTGDGSQGAPFKTLLKAGAAARDLAATSKNKNFVVFAAAGTYDEKTVTTAGGLTRVYDYEQNIRFVGAGAYGEGRSVIAGELDPDVAADADPYGRGPKAVRCARLSAYTSCLQNFEVRDGRCSFVDGDRSESNRGGGIYYGAMIDCHVVNCGAGRGQAAYQGRLERCRVTYPDPIPGARVMEDGGYAVSCIFEKEVGRGGNNGYTDARPMVQCSLYPDSSCRGINNSAAIYNCLSTAAQSPSSSSWNYSVRGMVCPFSIGLPKSGTPVPDYKQANPQFVDYENGDFRLKSTSPAIGYGSLRSQSNPDDDGGYWKTYGPDINGKPILFFDGKPLPGAVQELVQVLEIAASDYADVTPVGTQVVEPGESVTVTLTSPKRPPVGFTVGDEEVSGMTYTYMAPVGGIPTNVLAIAASFGTNWYANAAMPNDGGDGFTPETAKKTLISLCTNTYVRAGDVIHAAAGDYNEGAACHEPKSLFIRSRAIVKNGVTLVADAGEDETFITGAPAEGLPGGSIANGCGDTAIRCVTSYGGGILRGFTLRDGYTCAVSGVNNNCLGGGYLGLTSTARIEDCTITNCYSHRSALAHGGRYERCSLMGNNPAVSTGFDGNNLALFGGFYNCRIITSSNWAIMCPFVNCIMRNTSSNSTAGQYQIYASSADLKRLTNCVFACSIRNTNTGTSADDFFPAISNNIVCTGFGGTTPSAESKAWFKILTTAQIKEAYDYNHLSFKGTKSDLFCDAGVNVDSQMDAVDLYGNPRTMNGVIDLGPAEWDWRPTYTQTIAQPGVSVRDAAPMVVKEDEKVRVYDGDLVMNWTASSRKATIRRRMTFTVTGTGTLTVFADGEELGTYTQAADPQMIDFRNTLETSVVKFSYAKGEGDTGYVEIGETIGEPGVLLIIR